MKKPTPRAPPVQPPLSDFTDPWLVYATENQAVHAVDIINVDYGYPTTGKHAHDGSDAPYAQQTVTWAEPREIDPSAGGGWAFPAPDQDHLPSDATIVEYDPAWFPAGPGP